jgi:GDP-L-fucose synthase
MFKPDIIINLMAHVGSLQYVSKNAATVIHDNTQMYLNLYKIITETCPHAFVLNTLANCSYPGWIDIQNEDQWWDGPVHESVLSFGNSKRYLWVLAECYRKQHGIRSLCTILPNAYGIYDHTDVEKVHAMNGMIIRMIKAVRNGDKEFVIWGTGKPIREWIYMPDAARLIKLCLETPIEESFINFGQEQGISIDLAANLIKDGMNTDIKMVFDLSKPDGAPVKVLGGKRLKKYFPDFQFTSYVKGIKDTIEYYEKAL